MTNGRFFAIFWRSCRPVAMTNGRFWLWGRVWGLGLGLGLHHTTGVLCFIGSAMWFCFLFKVRIYFIFRYAYFITYTLSACFVLCCVVLCGVLSCEIRRAPKGRSGLAVCSAAAPAILSAVTPEEVSPVFCVVLCCVVLCCVELCCVEMSCVVCMTIF